MPVPNYQYGKRAASSCILSNGDFPVKCDHLSAQRLQEMRPVAEMCMACTRQRVIAPCGAITVVPCRPDVTVRLQSSKSSIECSTLNRSVSESVLGQTLCDLVAIRLLL